MHDRAWSFFNEIHVNGGRSFRVIGHVGKRAFLTAIRATIGDLWVFIGDLEDLLALFTLKKRS